MILITIAIPTARTTNRIKIPVPRAEKKYNYEFEMV